MEKTEIQEILQAVVTTGLTEMQDDINHKDHRIEKLVKENLLLKRKLAGIDKIVLTSEIEEIEQR